MNRNATPIALPDLHCSLCDGPLVGYPDDGVDLNNGVTVQCENICIPTCHENARGHGPNPKAAHIILCEHYHKDKE